MKDAFFAAIHIVLTISFPWRARTVMSRAHNMDTIILVSYGICLIIAFGIKLCHGTCGKKVCGGKELMRHHAQHHPGREGDGAEN